MTERHAGPFVSHANRKCPQNTPSLLKYTVIGNKYFLTTAYPSLRAKRLKIDCMRIGGATCEPRVGRNVLISPALILVKSGR